MGGMNIHKSTPFFFTSQGVQGFDRHPEQVGLSSPGSQVIPHKPLWQLPAMTAKTIKVVQIDSFDSYTWEV